MKLEVIGDSNKGRFDEGLANQVNAEIEAQERKKRLEEKLRKEPEVKKPNIQECEFDKSKFVLIEPNLNSHFNQPFYVAMERSRIGQNFYEALDDLHNAGSFMLTPKLFVEYAYALYKGNNKTKRVYDGNGTRLSKDKILELWSDLFVPKKDRSDKAEFLDTEFLFTLSGNINVLYRRFSSTNEQVVINEELNSDTLLEGKLFGSGDGLDIRFWLENCTSQGLPSKRLPKLPPILGYIPPRKGGVRVPIIYTQADELYLDCNSDPHNKSTVGVREAKLVK